MDSMIFDTVSLVLISVAVYHLLINETEHLVYVHFKKIYMSQSTPLPLTLSLSLSLILLWNRLWDINRCLHESKHNILADAAVY